MTDLGKMWACAAGRLSKSLFLNVEYAATHRLDITGVASSAGHAHR